MIYTLGETVLDILFRNNVAVSSTPGGSMLNASISLGRLGLPVSFISEYANDRVGDLIDDFLHDNGISTALVNRNSGKTPVALAFLDEKNDAHYQFYHQAVQTESRISLPDFHSGDIFLFGSFYAIQKENRKIVMALLEKARENDTVIIYDPNFRKPHLHQLPELKPFILENMAFADIIRASDEDFKLIFDEDDAGKCFNKIVKNTEIAQLPIVNHPLSILILTRNSKGVDLYTLGLDLHLDSKEIRPVSTIGAGDTFNSGVVYGLHMNRILKKDLTTIPSGRWKEILHFAIDLASEVCLSMDNYIGTTKH